MTLCWLHLLLHFFAINKCPQQNCTFQPLIPSAKPKQDQTLADKVARIEVLVAGEYVKKDEFERAIERLFDKLDHIEMKIDQKADK